MLVRLFVIFFSCSEALNISTMALNFRMLTDKRLQLIFLDGCPKRPTLLLLTDARLQMIACNIS